MNEVTKNLRKEILTVSHLVNAGHIPSAFSILEIIFSLYENVLTEKDEFILSKGHGCLAFYAVLLHKGLITKDQFYSFSKYDSILGGHPDRNKLKDIKASSGSLGHGLPIAVGIALSKKIKKEKGNIYCLIGDGECNEGTIWESLLLADKLNLDNLICIVDNNQSQVRAVPTNNLINKFSSFNLDTQHIYGHDIKLLSDTLSQKKYKPTVLVCDTIKGFGIKEMEDNMFSWHHGAPNKEKYEQFMKELS
jgi:transketolase